MSRGVPGAGAARLQLRKTENCLRAQGTPCAAGVSLSIDQAMVAAADRYGLQRSRTHEGEGRWNRIAVRAAGEPMTARDNSREAITSRLRDEREVQPSFLPSDPVGKDCQSVAWFLPPDRALPDCGNPPAGVEEPINRPSVPFDIAFELLPPEVHVRLRRRCVTAAGMSMPVAAVNEDGSAVAGKNDVRATWQLPYVQSVAKPRSMQETPDRQFGLRVPTTIGGHHPRTHFRRDDISHDRNVRQPERCGKGIRLSSGT